MFSRPSRCSGGGKTPFYLIPKIRLRILGHIQKNINPNRGNLPINCHHIEET